MLNPWMITGFTDGEGCFSLYVRADKQRRKKSVATYYRWEAAFAITLRGDDYAFLERVREYFRCGNCLITNKKDTSLMHTFGQCHLSIRSIEDLLSIVIPHFEKYPLESKKKNDFIFWKEAVKIISNARNRKNGLFQKVEYSYTENKRLIEIKEELRKRVTGGHLAHQSKWIQLQGTKNVINEPIL